MLGVVTPILVLQAFCVYHAYRNNSEQRWYWLILFFPLIGCVIYIVHNFNSASALSGITDNIKGVVISNYRIDQLEKALSFSDNITNKINLADEYVKVKRYQDAIALYVSCLQGFMDNDPILRMKLLRAQFLSENFSGAMELGNKLECEKIFKNSEDRVVYAWSLHYGNEPERATAIFEDMDKSFANYYHRKEYCKFLIMGGKMDIAKEKLTTLVKEFEHLKGPERRLNKEIFREIRDLREQTG
jgi:hypothetical protein